ncbi:MAG: class I SAM-dependent methyltransferase [Phycisphaerae bacterium]|nr:class I SAM-dependent methyltransferase [Phycisphaerae bacterium]
MNSTCGHLLDPRLVPGESGSRDASTHPDLRTFYEDIGRRFRCVPEFDPVETVRVRLILRLLPRRAGRCVLDVGCGDGHLCRVLDGRGFEHVVGTDLAGSRMDYARRHHPDGRFLQSNISALPFADGQFDVVTCVEVLEHVEDPERSMRELARVARRYVVCMTPYRESLAEQACPHCHGSFPPVGHLHSFDESRFDRMGRQAGLSLRRWRHVHPIFDYRWFRYFPPLRWLIAGYYRDSGFIGGLFAKT